MKTLLIQNYCFGEGMMIGGRLIGGGTEEVLSGAPPSGGDWTRFATFNCAFRVASAQGVHTAPQFGWNAPALPAWDAQKELFSTAILAVGITTPPQPGEGAPLYDGYPKDPWGSNRTGIGAFFMGVIGVAPSIVDQPDSQTATAGQTVTLAVVAEGTAPLSYQWYKKNDINTYDEIVGATNSTYVLTNIQPEQAGYFKVKVTNAIGFIWSNEAIVAINSSPQIVSCPPLLAHAGVIKVWEIPYKYQVRAIDADADVLTYSLVDKPPTMTINSATGLLTWIPTQEFRFTRVYVTVKVTDEHGAFTTQSWYIFILPGSPVSCGLFWGIIKRILSKVMNVVDVHSNVDSGVMITKTGEELKFTVKSEKSKMKGFGRINFE